MTAINNIVDRQYLKDLKKARAVLNYFDNRNDAGQRMTREMHHRRVHDRGLGATPQDILRALEEGQSPYVAMWMLVVSPDPRIQQMLPPDQVKEAIVEVADHYTRGLYKELGYEEPLYTIFVHDSIAANNLHRHHGHIVLQGMCPDIETGMPRNVFIEKRKGHFEVSDRMREQALDVVMSQRVGLDWRDRIPPLPGSMDDWEAQLADVEQILEAKAVTQVQEVIPEVIPLRYVERVPRVAVEAPAPEVGGFDLDFSL